MHGQTYTNGAAAGPSASGSSKEQQSNGANASGTSTASHPDDISHDLEIINHLYLTGFARGEFADCRLDVRIMSESRMIYGFHKLLLARSPTLLHYLRQYDSSEVVLPVSDPNITQEAIVTVIGYLYSVQAIQRLNTSNAKAILAAAIFLGLADVAALAAEVCRGMIASVTEPQDIAEWFAFLDTPNTSAHQQSVEPLYGAAAVQLKGQLLQHITQSLPQQLNAFSTSALPATSNNVASSSSNAINVAAMTSSNSSQNGAAASTSHGQATLIRIYASLPFDIFKSVIESAQFPPGDMERFSFAKRCISERKKVQPTVAIGENAVLAFGGGGSGASSVSVISKQKKSRPLWKVGESGPA